MTKKKANIIPEKISLFSINIFKAQLETSDDFLNNPQKVFGAEFGAANEVAHNSKEGLSRYRLFFKMDGLDTENEPLGVHVEYGIEFQFKVENFQDFIREPEEGVVQMDIALGATLLGMAYSTSRGIIFERTRGTFFDGIILPVIDPYKFLVEKEELNKAES